MSLVFKKLDYAVNPDESEAASVPRNKGSALSMLLERSRDSGENRALDTAALSPTASPSSSATSSPTSQAKSAELKPLSVVSNDGLGSMRIPSSSYRRTSTMQSSLQQQRNRALTGEIPAQGTPSSNYLGTSAGYGHLFGAGEIGSVSSPRHYTIPIQKEQFDPGSVEDRFVVSFPSPAPHSCDLKGSVSSLSKSLSKVSLSRSNSKSSITSMTSLRRFMEKPWKNDDFGSPESAAVSVTSGTSPMGSFIHSRKNSIASFYSGDDEIDTFSAFQSGKNTPTLGSTPNASLTQLEQAYMTNYHGISTSSSSQRRRQSLKAYGKLGKTLGEGAGGHVKIIRSNADNQIYAVKEFRARYHSESLRDYNKKVGAEYCLGLTLKHPNIVNTVDIIYETEKVYQIMEYGAYDLFAIVMSGKMSQGEVYCDFRQLMEGIRYLHNSGLAHRDLKLDNCVVTEEGIVKIIDFGSSVVYKYPESDKIYDCDGVVGSDPYLAPEAAGKGQRYTPTATDIWSAAIVLCCMLMRKFPWKAPRLSDQAFKAFVKEEEDGRKAGLLKLFSSLPEETHALLGGMLDVDPEKRFDINRCWIEPFLSMEPYCTLRNTNELVSAPTHTHTTVSFEEAHIAMLERKNRKAKKGEKMW